MVVQRWTEYLNAGVGFYLLAQGACHSAYEIRIIIELTIQRNTDACAKDHHARTQILSAAAMGFAG